MVRAYDMTKRGAAASDTSRRIVDATESLLTGSAVSEVTLQAIADAAGVTVQTVLRHMGSRDGCFAAVGDRVAQRNEDLREKGRAGDIDAAITGLVDHYEADGRLILNLLTQESRGDGLARRAVREGRSYHRSWVRRYLASERSASRPTDLDALVAATDLYTWKLLRLDLGRSRRATEAVMTKTVHALLAPPSEES